MLKRSPLCPICNLTQDLQYTPYCGPECQKAAKAMGKSLADSIDQEILKKIKVLVDVRWCDCGAIKAKTTHVDWCSTNSVAT